MLAPDTRWYMQENDDGEGVTATFTDIPKEDVIANEINKLRIQIRDSAAYLVFGMFCMTLAALLGFAFIMKFVIT